MAPAKFIRDNALTMWFSVPSVIGAMTKLRLLRAGCLPSLRFSLFCGEPLPAIYAQSWQEAAPNSILENLYGPTEATIAISNYRWDIARSPQQCVNVIVPIGWIFDRHNACVVDQDQRPDIDYAMRLPMAPHATLMGPYQHNMNKPGTSWFLPITDNGKLTSALVNLFDAWAMFPVDEFNGMQPAGVGEWVGEGKLELPIPLAAFDQLWFQVEQYPVGMMIQNIRLACESMGLGHWNYCGFVPEVILGAYPDLTPGLNATFAEPNAKAPIVTGAVKCIGWPGKWETTMVPSPKYPDAKTLVDSWYDEKYGDGAWGAEGDNNSLRQGQSPWKDPATVEGILAHPKAKPQSWVREAVQAHIEYCVENFGQFPVTYNPLQMHFGVVVHHLDTDFYDKYYKDGYVTDRHRDHEHNWH